MDHKNKYYVRITCGKVVWQSKASKSSALHTYIFKNPRWIVFRVAHMRVAIQKYHFSCYVAVCLFFTLEKAYIFVYAPKSKTDMTASVQESKSKHTRG